MASNSPPEPTASLKVMEAYTNDDWKNIARIDRETMKAIGASVGHIVAIEGKDRSTVALCMSLNPPDEGKGIIRLDVLTRNNATAKIGYTAIVRRIRASMAKTVVVMPLETIPVIDERYLATALEGIPVTAHDNVMVPYFGGRLTFRVVGIVPEQSQDSSVAVAVVTAKTEFVIMKYETSKIKCHISEYVRLLPDIDESAWRATTPADIIPKNSGAPFFLGLKLELFIGAISERIDFQKEMAGTKTDDMAWLARKYREIASTEVDEAGRKAIEGSKLSGAIEEAEKSYPSMQIDGEGELRQFLQELKYKIVKKWADVRLG